MISKVVPPPAEATGGNEPALKVNGRHDLEREHRATKMSTYDVVIPRAMIPSDGRFGSGPSKIPPRAVDALREAAASFLGTSHRRSTVRSVVGAVRAGLATLFSLPDGYEVVMGVGGTTVLWDALLFSLIQRRSQHVVCGEFSSKFARAAELAPHLEPPELISAPPGSWAPPRPSEAVDVHALIHNETSTGVAPPLQRVSSDSIVVVDATSAAGGLIVDPAVFDLYYFAPQKGFASDGGLWLALCSPAAVDRIRSIAATGRYVPPSLDLSLALANSRRDQTYNTPALATLFLLQQQLEWMLENGGLEWSAARSARSASLLYEWAEASDYAMPFVADARVRSTVVGTIDFSPEVDAAALASVLRANGIVDLEPYRTLGRNQLRVGMYPAVDPEDVARLTDCIDFVVKSGAAGTMTT
jgi:phosphoserine aminotransferase